METVTENSRGRGRPRKWERGDAHEIADYWKGPADDPELGDRPCLYSRRQEQNIVLSFRARDRIERVAENVQDYDNPTTPREEIALCVGGEGADQPPRTVLTELGRIEDEAAFWEAVDWYVQAGRRMLAKDAAAAIRRMRIGKKKSAPDPYVELYGRLARTVNAYRRQNPSVTREQEEDALEAVFRAVRRS